MAAPAAVLLALASPPAFAQLPHVSVHVDPPVHVQVPQVSVPHVNVGPPVVQHTVNPVIDHANSTVGSANSAVGGVSGGGGGGGGGSTNTPGGTSGGGQGSKSGSGGANGNGNGGGAGGGAGGAAARARRAAARRATARRVTAAIGRNRGTLGNAIDTAGGAPLNPKGGGPGIFRPIRDVIKVIPGAIKILIAALAALALAFYLRSFFAARRAKMLEGQRRQLLGDMGLFQRAVLPEVPERIGALDATVAYMPAEGIAAGGDFYDVFEMEGDRVGIIVGDLCGHPKDMLDLTALMRFTVRTYITGGAAPREALQIAARTLGNDPRAELTTVVVAVYDRSLGRLTYACAGHEPPILLGAPEHKPVTVASSPPIGVGMETGLRQTTVSLPPGSAAFFFTDGLVEARLGGGLLGRDRVADIARELGAEASAQALLDRVAERADRATDDMAACVIRARDDALTGDSARIEELELDGVPEDEERAKGFLEACGMDAPKAEKIMKRARAQVGEFGHAVIQVHLDKVKGKDRGEAKVLPCEPGVLRLARNGDGAVPERIRPITRVSA